MCTCTDTSLPLKQQNIWGSKINLGGIPRARHAPQYIGFAMRSNTFRSSPLIRPTKHGILRQISTEASCQLGYRCQRSKADVLNNAVELYRLARTLFDMALAPVFFYRTLLHYHGTKWRTDKLAPSCSPVNL